MSFIVCVFIVSNVPVKIVNDEHSQEDNAWVELADLLATNVEHTEKRQNERWQLLQKPGQLSGDLTAGETNNVKET